MPLYVSCAVFFFLFPFPCCVGSFQKHRLDACMRLWWWPSRSIYLYMKWLLLRCECGYLSKFGFTDFILPVQILVSARNVYIFVNTPFQLFTDPRPCPRSLLGSNVVDLHVYSAQCSNVRPPRKLFSSVVPRVRKRPSLRLKKPTNLPCSPRSPSE